MTTERIKGLYTNTCDGTGCHEFLEEADWESLRDLTRQSGWKVRKLRGTDIWQHFCPNCQSQQWEKSREVHPSILRGLK
jgi:hypothetical protein